MGYLNIIIIQSPNISYLKAENAGGSHILRKPDSAIQLYYFLVDDLNRDMLMINRPYKQSV